jgi:hypothetical protein
MVGTGEYTTGFVGGGASGSDKKVGVVGLTMFDLRRRGKVGKLSMVGTSGTKYPAIRNSPPPLSFSPLSLYTQLMQNLTQARRAFTKEHFRILQRARHEL